MENYALFPDLQVPRHFDGETYEPAEDKRRLTAQLSVVKQLMQDNRWWTIAQLCDAVWKQGYKGTQQGVSARIRDLRKARFGGHVVMRRRTERVSGEFEYRLLPHRTAVLLQDEAVQIAKQLDAEEPLS
jgi:hypothetical protein